MVLVPAGEFIMGFGESEHKVYLDPFYIDKFEVSNAMYKLCEKVGVCHTPVSPIASNYSGSQFGYHNDSKYANYPVVSVSWYSASAYCEWVGERLPTEAEWEKAASDAKITTSSNSEMEPVDSHPDGASIYRAINMFGNAPEWVSDWYQWDYNYTNSPYKNPSGPSSGTDRVVKGGSPYFSHLHPDGVSYNVAAHGGFWYQYVGFRCARDATP
jgi:formylglycine-generating enzyme required for sulfatase activity